MATAVGKHWLRIWMLALVLIASGVAGMYFVAANHFVSGVSEALLIAGILALVVDPLVKRDLLREASRGIFVHLLGFEHHPQVKDKLKEIIYGTKILRDRVALVVDVEVASDGFWVTVDYDSDIINAMNIPVPFEPFAEWDLAHKPQMLRMAITSADGKVHWTEKNVPLKETEPGVGKVSPHRVTLQPGVAYHGSGTYKIFSKHGYFITYAGLPTLQITARVRVPDGYEAFATPANVENDNYWEWNTIQMRGDHITIRWRKRDGEWV